MVNLPLFLFISFAILVNGIESCKPPALFVFGDSYVDPGNNNYINTSTQDKADFLPYGETYFKKPTGRFSDGRIIPDFLAQLANLTGFPLPFLCPHRKIDKNYSGASFASAGAGALNTTLPGFSISLNQQLEYYKDEIYNLSRRLGPAAAEKIVSEAVHLVDFGSTEFIVYFELNITIPDNQQLVSMMIGNLSTVIDTIYHQGGRKIVLLNLLNLGCSPGLKFFNTDNRTGPCLKHASDLVAIYNRDLNILKSKKAQSLANSKIAIFDLANSVAQRTTNKTKFGIKHSDDACCGYGNFNGRFSCGGTRPFKDYGVCDDPEDYLFWDSFHLTDEAYKNITNDVWGKSGTIRGLFDCYF